MTEYSYDAWGKLLTNTGTLASTVGVKNPYLYRGYRYDTETGLYYLQSRYYNPDFGRFINADDTSVLMFTQGDLLGANLFAYCGNNPVMYNDPSGYFSGKFSLNFGKKSNVSGSVSGGSSLWISNWHLYINLYFGVSFRIKMCASDWGMLKTLSSIIAGAIVALALSFIPGIQPAIPIIAGALVGVIYATIGYLLENPSGELDRGFSFNFNKIYKLW